MANRPREDRQIETAEKDPRDSDTLFLAAARSNLPKLLPEFLMRRRWFGGKARRILAVEVLDIVAIDQPVLRAYFVLAQIRYESGPGDTYNIPLIHLRNGESVGADPTTVISFRDPASTEDIVLADALLDQRFLSRLLDAIAQSDSFPGSRGEVRASSTSALPALWQPSEGVLEPSLIRAEQSNSSVTYGQRLMLKIVRRVEEGVNPDLEIGLFLTEQSSFRHVPPVAGHVEYLSREGTRTVLGILQGFVANQGDAWQFTLKALEEYYETAQRGRPLEASDIPQTSILFLSSQPVPSAAAKRIGPYLNAAALLGRRTAELHVALSSARQYPAFTPHVISQAEQQAFVSSATDLATANLALLRRLRNEVPEYIRGEVDDVLELEETVRQRFQLLSGRKLSAMLTRIHGDYHLGQVLFTGNDFVIIDFEGEPARPLEDRRKKRSTLQDVAGMLRSFHYAAYAPLLQKSTVNGPDTRFRDLGRWAYYWQKWVSATFLKAYLETSRDSEFIPKIDAELVLLLDAFLLDKAIYELGYELNNRPSWVRIPLEGISQLLTDTSSAVE